VFNGLNEDLCKGYKNNQLTACFTHFIIKAKGLQNVDLDALFVKMRVAAEDKRDVSELLDEWLKDWRDAADGEQRLRQKRDLFEWGLMTRSPLTGGSVFAAKGSGYKSLGLKRSTVWSTVGYVGNATITRCGIVGRAESVYVGECHGP